MTEGTEDTEDTEDTHRVCPGCNSKGFDVSVLGQGRCTYCDGTEGGQPPTHEEIEVSDQAMGAIELADRWIKGVLGPLRWADAMPPDIWADECEGCELCQPPTFVEASETDRLQAAGYALMRGSLDHD